MKFINKVAGPKGVKKTLRKVRKYLVPFTGNRLLFPFLALLGLVVISSLLSPNFLTGRNIKHIMAQVAVIATVAAGETYVILTGGIDLSPGALLAICGAATAALINLAGLPIIIAILGGLTMGALGGAINGLVVSKIKIPSFIITLAMMAVARGGTLVITGGRPISRFPDQFTAIAGYIGLFPGLIIIVIVVYTLGQFILSYTKMGRYIYATGGNEEAVRFMGINVDVVKIFVFAISGLLAGLGGVMLDARLDAAYPTAGKGYELDAIAASVLGGVSFTGGVGSLVGTFMGALIMIILGNLLNLLRVAAFYQYIAKGLILALAAISLSRGVKYAK